MCDSPRDQGGWDVSFHFFWGGFNFDPYVERETKGFRKWNCRKSTHSLVFSEVSTSWLPFSVFLLILDMNQTIMWPSWLDLSTHFLFMIWSQTSNNEGLTWRTIPPIVPARLITLGSYAGGRRAAFQRAAVGPKDGGLVWKAHEKIVKLFQFHRRKFRSQTSDNMER